MKHTGICPKCNSKKVGYLAYVIQRTEAEIGSRAVRGHSEAPIGTARSESGDIINVKPVGKLDAYICGSCGFYETYIKNPSKVQFESIIDFKWINPS